MLSKKGLKNILVGAMIFGSFGSYAQNRELKFKTKTPDIIFQMRFDNYLMDFVKTQAVEAYEIAKGVDLFDQTLNLPHFDAYTHEDGIADLLVGSPLNDWGEKLSDMVEGKIKGGKTTASVYDFRYELGKVNVTTSIESVDKVNNEIELRLGVSTSNLKIYVDNIYINNHSPVYNSPELEKHYGNDGMNVIRSYKPCSKQSETVMTQDEDGNFVEDSRKMIDTVYIKVAPERKVHTEQTLSSFKKRFKSKADKAGLSIDQLIAKNAKSFCRDAAEERSHYYDTRAGDQAYDLSGRIATVPLLELSGRHKMVEDEVTKSLKRVIVKNPLSVIQGEFSIKIKKLDNGKIEINMDKLYLDLFGTKDASTFAEHISLNIGEKTKIGGLQGVEIGNGSHDINNYNIHKIISDKKVLLAKVMAGPILDLVLDKNLRSMIEEKFTKLTFDTTFNKEIAEQKLGINAELNSFGLVDKVGQDDYDQLRVGVDVDIYNTENKDFVFEPSYTKMTQDKRDESSSNIYDRINDNKSTLVLSIDQDFINKAIAANLDNNREMIEDNFPSFVSVGKKGVFVQFDDNKQGKIIIDLYAREKFWLRMAETIFTGRSKYYFPAVAIPRFAFEMNKYYRVVDITTKVERLIKSGVKKEATEKVIASPELYPTFQVYIDSMDITEETLNNGAYGVPSNLNKGYLKGLVKKISKTELLGGVFPVVYSDKKKIKKLFPGKKVSKKQFYDMFRCEITGEDESKYTKIRKKTGVKREDIKKLLVSKPMFEMPIEQLQGVDLKTISNIQADGNGRLNISLNLNHSFSEVRQAIKYLPRALSKMISSGEEKKK